MEREGSARESAKADCKNIFEMNVKSTSPDRSQLGRIEDIRESGSSLATFKNSKGIRENIVRSARA